MEPAESLEVLGQLRPGELLGGRVIRQEDLLRFGQVICQALLSLRHAPVAMVDAVGGEADVVQAQRWRAATRGVCPECSHRVELVSGK